MAIRLKPLSLSVFTTIFVMAFLILLFSIGHLTYREIDKLDSKFRAANELRAESEVQSTLYESINLIEQKTGQLAAWEELTQQLNNSTFYTYWHRYRSKSSSFVSDYTLDVALYDHQGEVLAPIDTSLLPAKINLDNTDHYLRVSQSEPLLVVIKPVVDASTQRNLGYVATISRLLPVFNSLGNFNQVDPNSLSIDIIETDRIESPAFVEHIHYQLSSDPYTEAMKTVIEESLLHLANIAFILTLLIFPLAAWLVNRPILQISQQIDQLKKNPQTLVNSHKKTPLLIKELDKIQDSLNVYHNQLNQVNTTLDEKTRELNDLTHHDPLTGALNRTAFDNYWHEVSDVFQYSPNLICLMLFDINHFKALNDTYGHQAGDEVLIAISQTIKNIFRGRERLFRIGGDEFASVLIGVNPRKAMQIAKQCHQAITNYPFNKLGINEPVRMSIGLAHTKSDENESINSLQWQADIAIHFAKRPGYSSIVRFTSELAENAQGLFSNRTHSAVYEAITRGTGLVMHYQPIVNLEDGKPQYYEALLRIVHEGQLIMPSHIFPLVEARSLELDLDRQVIAKIIEDLQNQVIPIGTGVSINISAPAIVESELLKWLAAFKPHMNDYKLLIEVTETALITQLQTARNNLESLRSMGFRVALDDFGSGYSSLRYLGAMPVDVVKFDITLTRLLDDEANSPILNYLAKMITESGHLLVAEGIESVETAEQLAKLGFRYGQGYYFGRPTLTIQSLESTDGPVNYSA
ncbi:MAG: bifunctional diguanylate cyclase/phosphodiesterase [Candidatus Thiodiazotropha sp. (ex Lucinoma borealis)]|nr:bifunctional diguanylate cyclase/phosphodiesterase [Candidatus Thiodiazotropha sp. (ex Lucinoma borealis)]MCU7840432.1 bifunctional diguanylate cyclase/phosphodiesterase [Candidatus Thiodiazotropha sp. (ex Troendleina suluensis)]MCU7870245.1 bifunctional diguanylate cyclase/phosphodiesterase [Candidatus Thiodiazotropha sp. (ex Lucinoma borealis)]